MNQEHQQCQHINLAEERIGSAILCPSCGIVTVNLPHLSVRFEAGAFAGFVEMLVQAHANLLLLAERQSEHSPRQAAASDRALFAENEPLLH